MAEIYEQENSRISMLIEEIKERNKKLEEATNKRLQEAK